MASPLLPASDVLPPPASNPEVLGTQLPSSSQLTPRSLPGLDTHTSNHLLNPLAPPFSPPDAGLFSLSAAEDDFDLDHIVWEHFLEASGQDSAASPAPCACHNRPRGSCPSIIEETIRLVSTVSAVPAPNMDGARIKLPYGAFPIDAWRETLGKYFDASNLVEAYVFGWDMSFLAAPTPFDAPRNLPSAALAPEDVDQYISTELAHGALVGPVNLALCPFKIFHNPIGTVPKANSKVRRTIVDASQKGKGINQFIPKDHHRGEPWHLTLPSVDTIIASIRAVRRKYPGQKIQMFKVDYSRWYRVFPLDPGQIRFLAIKWRGKTYLDRYFSFGNRGAALAAQRTSWAVCWIFRTQISPAPGSINSGLGCSCSSHCQCGENDAQAYIDDSICLVPESLAQHQFQEFMDLCRKLGLAISKTPGHVFPPSEQCVALGILFNLEDNTISLPEDKLRALLDIIHDWLAQTRADDRQLARLAGKLLWASRVVRPGRVFLNRVLATKRWAASLSAPIYIDSAFRADVQWWADSLISTNGISFLVPRLEVEVSLDASSNGWHGGRPGLAGVNHSTGEFFAAPAPPEFESWHISAHELICHLIAIRLWGHQWSGQQIRGKSDSEPCVFLLKNGKSRVDLRLHMARTFATLQLTHNCIWQPEWISTKDNVMPDALSRLGEPGSWGRFCSEAARLGIQPKESPISPWMFAIETSPDDVRSS